MALQSFRPETPRQGHLFGDPGPDNLVLMETVDHLIRKMERGTVDFAAAGVPGGREWTMKRQQRSPPIPDSWANVPVATAEE